MPQENFSPEYKSEREKLEELKDILYKKAENIGFIIAHEKIVQFIKKIENEYKENENVEEKNIKHELGRPKLNHMKLYHLIIGSTINDKIEREFDTPTGEIEKFIREEL